MASAARPAAAAKAARAAQAGRPARSVSEDTMMVSRGEAWIRKADGCSVLASSLACWWRPLHYMGLHPRQAFTSNTRAWQRVTRAPFFFFSLGLLVTVLARLPCNLLPLSLPSLSHYEPLLVLLQA